MVKIFPIVKKLSSTGPPIADAFRLAMTMTESNALPIDAASFAFTFPDSVAVQTETALLGLSYTDTNSIDTDAVTYVMNALYTDTNPIDSDVVTFLLNTAYGDTSPTSSDAATLNIKGLGDTSVSPTESVQLSFPSPDFGDTSSAPTDVSTFVFNAAYSDTSAAQTETAQMKFPAPDFADTSATPTETRSLVMLSYATGCSDADSTPGRTNPGNANGPPDGVLTKVSTNLGIGDTTNPQVLTTGSMNYPSGLTNSNLQLLMWFKIVDTRAAATDTVTISFNDGSGHSGTAWTWGTTAEDHTAAGSPLVFNLPAGTVLNTLVVKGTYNAAVVASPQSALGIQIDALAIRATTTL